MVSTAFHGALKHSDLAFVTLETLSSCVVCCLDGLRGWWVGRQTNAQLQDNDCRSKAPRRWRVHEMWIHFHGEDWCSWEQKANQVKYSFQPQVWNSLSGTQALRKFPQLFKVYTRKEQSRQGCSHSGKPAARLQESEVSSYHWEFTAVDPRKNRTETDLLRDCSAPSPPVSPVNVTA